MDQLKADVITALEEALVSISPELNEAERRFEAESMLALMSKDDILAILNS